MATAATASHPASASTSGRDALAASSSSPPPCHRPSAAQPPSSSTSSPPPRHRPSATPPPYLLAAMDAGNDEQPVLLDRVARATRGKRMYNQAPRGRDRAG